MLSWRTIFSKVYCPSSITVPIVVRIPHLLFFDVFLAFIIEIVLLYSGLRFRTLSEMMAHTRESNPGDEWDISLGLRVYAHRMHQK